MRCAVYTRNTMTRSRQSSKSKPISITRVSSTHCASDSNVTVVDPVSRQTGKQSQQQQQRPLVHKPVKSEVPKKDGSTRGTGGRHLQPPSGNNTKLKHECPFDGCPWRFATPYKLRRHIKSHTKETPYQCKECGRGFSVRYNLLMHIQTIHSTPQKYKCPISGCKEAFHTQPRLNGHLRKIHKKDWKQLQMEQQGKQLPLKKSSDTIGCSEPSSSITPPSEDCSTSSSSNSSSSSSKWYRCIDCGKEFTSQAKLSAHMKAHSGNYHCTVQGCSKSFQTSDKLAKHLDTSHKSIQCPNKGCTKAFLKQSQLKNHIRVHNSKYTCTKHDCNLKFDNEADYNDHMNVHKGYSLLCPFKQCNLTFPTQNRLELHYRVAHLSSKQNSDMLLSQFAESTQVDCSSSTSSSTSSSVLSNGVRDKEDNFMEALELPDLKVEDVEAVMFEHTNWTGDQIETFLKSLDIEELEHQTSLKSSLSGYESDSGYSAHEVSPMTVGGSTAHYCSALSPAITPVTPSPILSSTSSATSPVPFCLYPDDIYSQQIQTAINTPNTSSTGGSNDFHFFGSNTTIPVLAQTLSQQSRPHSLSPAAVSSTGEHFFHSPVVCQSKEEPHTALQIPPFQSMATQSQPFVSFNQSSKGTVQSVLPPVSNISDIEANRHSVTVVPNNSFCNSTSTSPLSHGNSNQNDSSQQFDIDGYLDMLSSAASTVVGSDKEHTDRHNGTANYSKYSALAEDNATDLLERIHSKLKQPLTIGINDSDSTQCGKALPTATDTQQDANELGKVISGNDVGGVVIAQVLLSPKRTAKQQQQQQQHASSGFVQSSNVKSACKTSKTKGKGRHHSASVSSVNKAQHGRVSKNKKTNWPKSMNNGNLMAFRNFILGKLKQSPPDSCTFATPTECLTDSRVGLSHSVPPTPTFFSVPSDDIFNDIGFNPDTFLTSEQSLESSSFSPFSHHSESISPSPVPMSPSLESSMNYTSLSSLSSDRSPCPNGSGIGIDGFIQCLSVDPVMSQGFEEPLMNQAQLVDEFSHVLKTDTDPLLGGLS